MKEKKRNITIETLGIILLYLCITINLLFLFLIIYFISIKGLSVISLEFITKPPDNLMRSGGIAPAILGTFYLTVGAILFALPFGIATAIYLCEYAQKSYTVNIIRISINNLAGVPSVIFGLFGLSVFVYFLKFGVSILSGALTLGILVLPGIISATQEALMAVPNSLREASYALGATKWKTIKKVVLPTALPGILTGIILSIGRAAGETAPIIFTAATLYTRNYPKSIFSDTMALPYHIYALMTEGTFPQEQKRIAFGAALVLLILILLISSLAIYIRAKQRKGYVY